MVSSVLNYCEQSIIFYLKVVFVIVEELILLNAFHFHSFKCEIVQTRLLLVAVKGIKVHAIYQVPVFVEFLLAAEKVHSQWFFSFLNLSSYSINWMLQHFESINSSIKVHDFAAHSNKHSSHKDPHFFFHFLRLHQRWVKIYLLKLEPLFRLVSFLKITCNAWIRGLREYYLRNFFPVETRKLLPTLKTIMLIPPQWSNFFFQLLNLTLQVMDSSFSVGSYFVILFIIFVSFIDSFSFGLGHFDLLAVVWDLFA